MTLAEYGPQWLEHCRGRGLDPDTVLRYELYLRRHILPVLGRLDVAAVRGKDVRALGKAVMAKGLSPGTVRTVLAALSALYRQAERDDMATDNPVRGQLRDFQAGFGRPLHPDDLGRLLERIAVEQKAANAIFLVLYRTGLRIAEALGLQWADVDLEGAQLLVARQWKNGRVRAQTKNGRTRLVYLTPATVALLAAHPRRHRTWVFASSVRPVPFDSRTVQDRFARLCHRAGIAANQYTLHALRHTYATNLVAAGADLRDVSDQLGHSSIVITSDRYSRAARRPVSPHLGVLDVAPTFGVRHPPRSLTRAANRPSDVAL